MGYMLFMGHDYYPCGGWEDYIQTFESVEDAIDFAKTENIYSYDWFHVVCVSEKSIVIKGRPDE